jgi:hypothetical protein
MTSVATACTAVAVVISVDEEARSNRSGHIHNLHKVRKGETRVESDGEVNNTIKGIFEEAVVAADSLRDEAKLLEVGANVISGEAVRDCRHPHGGDGVARGPAVDESIVAGSPWHSGGEAGQEAVVGGGGGEGDSQKERGRIRKDAFDVSNRASQIFDEEVGAFFHGIFSLHRAQINEKGVFIEGGDVMKRSLMKGARR